MSTCEQALCKKQLLLRLWIVSLPLWPIDGDAALPVVEWTHDDPTLLGLWVISPPKNKETAVVKSCRCPPTMD